VPGCPLAAAEWAHATALVKSFCYRTDCSSSARLTRPGRRLPGRAPPARHALEHRLADRGSTWRTAHASRLPCRDRSFTKAGSASNCSRAAWLSKTRAPRMGSPMSTAISGPSMLGDYQLVNASLAVRISKSAWRQSCRPQRRAGWPFPANETSVRTSKTARDIHDCIGDVGIRCPLTMRRSRPIA
jgi:hypothetical protein